MTAILLCEFQTDVPGGARRYADRAYLWVKFKSLNNLYFEDKLSIVRFSGLPTARRLLQFLRCGNPSNRADLFKLQAEHVATRLSRPSSCEKDHGIT